jgi:hypothetical protein
MRFRAISGLLLAIGWVVSALGQPAAKLAREGIPKTVASSSAASLRLASSEDGVAILGAALESKGPSKHARSDCSHLVHMIYERAGFPYAYARSSDLYRGTEDFQRVAQPQAGDIVVWRGHAGIVVDPHQHTFFSALRSGFGVQPYDSAYWRGRGHPHFLRYTKRRQPSSLVSSNHGPSPSSHLPNLKPTGMHVADDLPPLISASKSDEMFDDDPLSPKAQGQDAIPTPHSIVIQSRQPTAQAIRAALTVSFRDTADVLQSQDVFEMSSALICFDDFEVKKIQRKGKADQGWVEFRLVAPAPITGKSSHGSKIADRQRWALHRNDAESWQLTFPEDAVYLPRSLAVRVLAHQLASLTESTEKSSHEKQAQLARWLDVLLDESHSH